MTAKAEPAKGPSLDGATASTRPDDLVAYFKPRIEVQPWTAPAYDSRPVAADPEVYCIAVDDGRWSCMTDQGTRYEMDKKICRSIAANGVYNPYRRPAGSGQQGQASQANQPQQVPQENASGAGASGATGWPGGVGAQSYTPPGAPGSWNADAFGGSSSRR
ncbi:MAG: hypothetical protein KGN77_15485 [Xanthomonadaceae bacterium]|nr:hypothetical protein [Xanthomonadaceae bacterium]MDE1964727.1 hypothetical protein [Xanthomonadaceae bacterium]